MATDEQLIQQIQKGNSEAYGQLFRKYYQQIYSICFSILQNSHDAEEVTSETFIHAYLKLSQLKKLDKFFAWLKKIAKNRSKNYMRQRKTQTIPLDFQSAETAEKFLVQGGIAPLTQIAPDEYILKQELTDSILEAVEALPPKDREVVRAYIDGLNHAEISQRFGISANASMTRVCRARKKITAHVKDLLNAIFALPQIFPLKKILSGGTLAMKMGTSTKITIGVVGVLAAGFIGFKTMTLNKPEVQSSRVETQQAVIAKREQGGETVVGRKQTRISFHQSKDIGREIAQDRQETIKFDERELETFLAWLDDLEKSSSVDEGINKETEQLSDEKYTEQPTELEEPAKKLAQKILEDYRNADIKAILPVAKGKMREILEAEYEPPSAEDKALAKQIEISDSWYLGDDEFHFVISLHGYNIEYILQRDETGWWLVDGIPDVIETTSYYYKEIK